jgi:hypothetical protein
VETIFHSDNREAFALGSIVPLIVVGSLLEGLPAPCDGNLRPPLETPRAMKSVFDLKPISNRLGFSCTIQL